MNNIKYTDAKNPRWANAQNSSIDCEVKFTHLGDYVLFNANPQDSEAHGQEIYQRCVNGEFGAIDAYIEPPIPEPQPKPVPDVVTMRQARLALLQQNLLASVEAAVAQAGTAAQIEWQYATELKRTHPLTISISAALGLTEQQLDDLFTLASTL